MRVVFLSAGVGSRLGNLTKNIHKSLLKLTNKENFIDIQLKGVKKANISEISYITGHASKNLINYLLNYEKEFNIKFIQNDFYLKKNLDYGVFLALKDKGSVIYYEADTLVHIDLIKELKNSKSDICIALDPLYKCETIDIIVNKNDQGNIGSIKLKEHGSFDKKSCKKALGVLICVIKFSDKARSYMLNELSKTSFTKQMKFLTILEKAISLFNTSYVDMSHKNWVEVDDIKDYNIAKKLAKEDKFKINE